MCLGVFLLGSNFFGTLWASRTSWKSISFTRLRFSLIICSNKFSISCSSSSPCGTPMIQLLEHLKLSQRFLSLSFFLNSFFFIVFWLNVYFFLLLQIIDLSPGFLPSLLVPCIFSFISLCIDFTFSSILQPFLWASWLPVFWTVHLHCLVLFFLELWSVLSFGPYFFVSEHVVRGRAWGILQGGASHVTVMWHCLWGSGQRGNMPLAGSALPILPSLPSLPTSGLWPWVGLCTF